MKNKILILIIGILIGAILTTTAFLIYNSVLEENSRKSQLMQTNGKQQSGPLLNGNIGEPPEMSNGNRRTTSDISNNNNNI